MHDKFRLAGRYRLPSGPPVGDPFAKLGEATEFFDAPNEADYLFEGLMQERREFCEQLLFQNLVPAFDAVPMRRVFMLCVYSPIAEDLLVGPSFTQTLDNVVQESNCKVFWQYPELTGSRLVRCALQTHNRLTRREFEDQYGQIADEIAKRLTEQRERNVTIVNNFYPTETAPKKHSKEWSEKLKDFSESLKNLVLVGAGICFLIDGTLVKRADSDSKDNPHISILKVPREKEVELLPEILEATSPQDFRKAVEPLNSESLGPTEKKTGRKFR